jgi:hypothetical protein
VMQELKEKGATVRNSGFYNLGWHAFRIPVVRPVLQDKLA